MLLPSESHLFNILPSDDENDDNGDDDEGEDLFGSDLVEKDYAENEKLDAYNKEYLDEEQYSDLDNDTRYIYIYILSDPSPQTSPLT